jgi:hypothetical protein
VIGTSLPANASTAPVTGFLNPVTWTFTGGLQIIDNQTYSAIINTSQNLAFRTTFVATSYPNGSLRFGTGGGSSGVDTVFQGTFSAATPVPFEFSPALGLGALGGLFALKKLVKKKKAS